MVISFFILLITLLIAAKSSIFPLSFKELAINILPSKVLERFSIFENLEVFTSNADSQFISALDFIKIDLFLDGELQVFTIHRIKHDECCYTSFGQWYGHTHNIQLEMALIMEFLFHY